MSIRLEFQGIQAAMRRYLAEGGTMLALSRELGANRATLINYLHDMPESVYLAAQLQEAMQDRGLL